MTKKQCETCATITKYCQDLRYEHLDKCECLNYEPYSPFPFWVNK